MSIDSTSENSFSVSRNRSQSIFYNENDDKMRDVSPEWAARITRILRSYSEIQQRNEKSLGQRVSWQNDDKYETSSNSPMSSMSETSTKPSFQEEEAAPEKSYLEDSNVILPAGKRSFDPKEELITVVKGIKIENIYQNSYLQNPRLFEEMLTYALKHECIKNLCLKRQLLGIRDLKKSDPSPMSNIVSRCLGMSGLKEAYPQATPDEYGEKLAEDLQQILPPCRFYHSAIENLEFIRFLHTKAPSGLFKDLFVRVLLLKEEYDLISSMRLVFSKEKLSILFKKGSYEENAQAFFDWIDMQVKIKEEKLFSKVEEEQNCDDFDENILCVEEAPDSEDELGFI